MQTVRRFRLKDKHAAELNRGASHDRDVNAARNILRRGLATLAEGAAKERRSQLYETPREVCL